MAMTTALNDRHHRTALNIFIVIVVVHWAEHLAQAVQIYALGWTPKEARGVLGLPFPWLVSSEWMHYGYALIMLVFLIALRKGFTGRAKAWWTAALVIQFWHHFEHLLLLGQVLTGSYLAGKAVPSSILQLIVPRVELHLFYNTVVTIPMIVAMILHRRPSEVERHGMNCNCAVTAA